MQLISEAEGRQADLLQVFQSPKPYEKSSEIYPLTRLKRDVRQTKAAQVGHLTQQTGDFTQISLIDSGLGTSTGP